jgi:cytochrome c oxidase assembly protein subunit 15
MTAAPAYDLAPLAHIALLGAVLASGPLLWLGLRHRHASPAARLRALTVLALFFCFDLVLVGAYTRLSDSGLGCPDWPGCYGNASPIGAQADIHAAQIAQPSGPVTRQKAWVEMLHRYLATGVGALIAALAVASWLGWKRRQVRLAVPLWASATLAWVCVQGAFGALTVTWKLYPAIVTAHLLGGMVLLALLAAQSRLAAPAPLRLPRGLQAGVHAVAALVMVQIALGGWVSTNYAVLACTQFPTCQGSWWPAMDFAQGFELWRHLGVTGAGDTLAFPALTAIHYVHRLSAYAVFLVLGAFAWQLRHAMPRQAKWMGGLLAWQFATGLSNVVLGWPLVAAVAHTGGAAALVVVLTWTWCESRAGAADPALHTRVPAPEAAR